MKNDLEIALDRYEPEAERLSRVQPQNPEEQDKCMDEIAELQEMAELMQQDVSAALARSRDAHLQSLAARTGEFWKTLENARRRLER